MMPSCVVDSLGRVSRSAGLAAVINLAPLVTSSRDQFSLDGGDLAEPTARGPLLHLQFLYEHQSSRSSNIV